MTIWIKFGFLTFLCIGFIDGSDDVKLERKFLIINPFYAVKNVPILKCLFYLDHYLHFYIAQ